MSGNTEWCHKDNCGVKMPVLSRHKVKVGELFACLKCFRLWRRTYLDLVTGNEAFICYESELEEEAQNGTN